MPQITTNFLFSTESLDAAEHYVSIFPNSEITQVSHYSEAGPLEAGGVLAVDFVLDGQPFTAINGGPDFNCSFDESVSLRVSCRNQEEVDYYWSRLGEGGQESQCGWLKDCFGFSWQVTPVEMGSIMGDPDPERAARAMNAMLAMSKIDLNALRRAANGE